MVAIGNADQVMALVRAQLERMTRAKRTGGPGKAAKSEAPRVSGENQLQALGVLADLGEDEFERMLVRTLLSQEFGDGVSNDARFQDVVDQTMRVLRGDPAMAKLMAEAGALVRGK